MVDAPDSVNWAAPLLPEIWAVAVGVLGSVVLGASSLVVDASTDVGGDAPLPSWVNVEVYDPLITVIALPLMIVVTWGTEVVLPTGGTTMVCA